MINNFFDTLRKSYYKESNNDTNIIKQISKPTNIKSSKLIKNPVLFHSNSDPINNNNKKLVLFHSNSDPINNKNNNNKEINDNNKEINDNFMSNQIIYNDDFYHKLIPDIYRNIYTNSKISREEVVFTYYIDTCRNIRKLNEFQIKHLSNINNNDLIKIILEYDDVIQKIINVYFPKNNNLF